MNGSAGADYNITRGNNVYAYQDRFPIVDRPDANSSPNGGASLLFDYPIDFTARPDTLNNAKAAVTNLFYMNNIMHDISAKYGFTPASGNFQENNYGAGGLGFDPVLAEAHDASGFDNANFNPAVDGFSGRMQMYLWNVPGGEVITVNSPASIAGPISVFAEANFGPCEYDATGNAVLAVPSRGCTALTNAAAVAGKIAIIDRGGSTASFNCTFQLKVKNAQDAGAIGVIIVDSVPGNTLTTGGMAASGNPNAITIPSIFVTKDYGNILKSNINGPLNITLKRIHPNGCLKLDCAYDNGVIAHEYTHGISNRLTGSGAGCLQNDEQAGEGWSDFFALFLTHKPTDTKAGYRGMGSYVSSQPTNGEGFREFPYSYDMSINPHTYADVKEQRYYSTTDMDTVVTPHGVGSIWCAMLYDLYWNMIDKYGYSTDLYNGNGGNNKTLKLVMEGLKLQKCSPGFVDSRDAILKADSILNGYANKCIIWKSFARRGLGYSAKQGSSQNVLDQVVAFDVPPSCDIPVPTALMQDPPVNICEGQIVNFNSVSTGSSLTINWNFGGGGTPNTSTANAPAVQFNTVGTYTITLTASNSAGSSSISKTLIVNAKPNVTVNSATLCSGQSVTLTAGGASTYVWTPGGANTASISITPTLTTNYYVVGTATNGCKDTATSAVTVNASPIANSGNDKVISCITPSVQLGTAGVAGNTYTWTPTAGLSSSTVAQPNATIAANYRVVVTTTATGCSDTDFVEVTANVTTPNANAGADKAITCTASTVQLNGSSTTSGVTYSWSGPGIVSGGTTATPTVNSAGTYTVTVTNPANGCTATDVAIVSNNSALPNANAGVDKTITCTALSVQLNGSSTSSGVSFSWSGSGIVSGGATATANAAGTYTLTVTNPSNSCTSTDVVIVTANNTLPVVSASNAVICTGQQGTLTANGANSYSWTGPGIVSGGTTATVTVNAAGTYTVTGTNTSNGCTATATGIVTINNAVPTITVNSPTICTGESVILTASGASTYTWNTGASGASITVSPNITTVYTVVGATSCNSGNGSSTVTVNTKPTVSVTDATGCAGSSQTLNASGASSYTWSNGGSGASINVTVGSTNSTIEVIGTSTGCKDTATANITVLPSPATPSITRADSVLTCTVVGTSYKWYKDGVLIPSATSQSYKMGSNGVYKVEVYNSDNCKSEATLSVISLPVKSNSISGIQIIPNPNKGVFAVQLQSGKNTTLIVELYATNGQKVMNTIWEVKAGQNTFNVVDERLADGMYFLNMNNEEGTSSMRIVVQR
jgi:PKD repeat protein